MKKKEFVVNLIFLVSFIGISSFILSYVWVGVIDQNANFFKYLEHTTSSFTYDYYTNKHLNDTIVIQVLDLCGVMDGEDQVRCVVSQFNHLFEYLNHTETIRSPDELIENGGVCRDAVVFYSSIFKQLGYDIRYSYPFEFHVYISVDKQINDTWFYCDIDQNQYNCVELA